MNGFRFKALFHLGLCVLEVMSGKFAKVAEDAKRYAAQHDLERTVTQMDPDAHMLRFLLSTCSPEQLRDAPVKITRDSPVRAVGLQKLVPSSTLINYRPNVNYIFFW
eukprot:Skav222944  [mRNA]  locus=scaffold1489:545208:546142:- [translate_table: standard]